MSPPRGHRTPPPSKALELRGRPLIVRAGGNVDDVDETDFDAVATATIECGNGTARATFAAGGMRSFAQIGKAIGASAGSAEHWISGRREPSFAWKIALGFGIFVAQDEAEARATRATPGYDESAPATRLRGLEADQ